MSETLNESQNPGQENPTGRNETETKVVEYSLEEKQDLPDNIKDKLLTLYELSKVDNELAEIEEEKGDLPELIEKKKKRIEELNDGIKECSDTLEELEKEAGELDKESKACETIINKYDEQKYNVKSNKEYDDIVKSIDVNYGIIEKNEKRVKEIEQQREAAIDKKSGYESELEEEKTTLEESESALNNLNSEFEQEELELKNQRKKLSKKLDETEQNLYNRINKLHKGEAVTIVRKENCSGCFNSIPPQKVIEIRTAIRIFTCQSCGRILVDDGLVNTEEEI